MTSQAFHPLDGVDDNGRMKPKNYDAIVLASFGGPEGQEDVIPFLRNVTQGRGIPDERLEEVSHHYRANGGISPINSQNRALKAAMETELASRGMDLPVYWGNRNWAPFIADTLQEAYDAGHRRVLTVTTSAYSCYSSCRQYREDLGVALVETGLDGKLEVDKVRQYFDHPGFVEPFVEGVTAGLAGLRQKLSESGAADAPIHILFATHSIPTGDADAAGPRVDGEADGGPAYAEGAYVAQHLATAQAVLDRVPESTGVDWSLVYQSRSGAPHVPWLEPDINDAIKDLAVAGTKGVVIVPLGFVSDHMEVKWDLDTEALETCADLGVIAERVPTPGTHDKFVAGLIDLVCERTVDNNITDRPAATNLGPWFDVCRPNCCANRRGPKPTVAAADSTVGLPGTAPAS
ncbi:ferrochelatase [Arthrobacter sp. H20]|uniref:ferrochelatase n=1 Tax=Arthrobacter sp. H20 TaxID=1267981 RepID=UPI0004786E60|nr:ferrochelatase [Arthrobacter sp. H20]